MWLGHSAYLEIADGAIADFGGATTRIDDGHGYIAVDEIRMSNRPAPGARRPRSDAEPIASTWTRSIAALATGAGSPGRLGWRRPSTRRARSRRRSPSRRWPWRSPTGPAMDEHVHIRGSHKNLGEVVPRRFLEVLGGTGMVHARGRQRPARAGAAGWSTRRPIP